MSKARYWAVIPAAGKGQRFGGDLPKQYLPLAGKTVIEWAMHPFLEHAAVAGLVVALGPDDIHWARLQMNPAKPVWTVMGGASRAESVASALAFLKGKALEDDWILVHDAARPCLPSSDLKHLLQWAGEGAAAILAVPVSDTLKQSNDDGLVIATPTRDHLWRALTPQMCRYGKLHQALGAALEAGLNLTDESAALEQAGERVHLVEGSAANIKITRPADLLLAEKLKPSFG